VSSRAASSAGKTEEPAGEAAGTGDPGATDATAGAMDADGPEDATGTGDAWASAISTGSAIAPIGAAAVGAVGAGVGLDAPHAPASSAVASRTAIGVRRLGRPGDEGGAVRIGGCKARRYTG
jgi:hypothetical protein